MLVSKFGGSSLSSESQFKKVKNIVTSDVNRQVIVVSALGKRDVADNKLTDLFYVIHAHAEHDICYASLWQEVAERFKTVKTILGLCFDIESALAEIKSALDRRALSVDDLVSRGEYLTARLMAEYLDYTFVDAKDVIIFGANGEIDMDLTATKLKAAIPTRTQAVIPGFYGAYLNGKIKLFGRGGSDISGAIVAAALGADKYENFTDVSGVLMADPRIINNPPAITGLTFEELSELTYMGASVLHEASSHPVRDVGIPIHIKNTNAPEAAGTLISEDFDAETTVKFTGISGKKDVLSFSIYKNHMATEVGFLQRMLAIFAQFNVNIEHVPTGIDHVGVVVMKESVANCMEELVATLKTELNADEVLVKDNSALITIVGRGIVEDAAFLGRIFTALAKHDINISFISQSPKKLNIILGVKNEDYVQATIALYEALVG